MDKFTFLEELNEQVKAATNTFPQDNEEMAFVFISAAIDNKEEKVFVLGGGGVALTSYMVLKAMESDPQLASAIQFAVLEHMAKYPEEVAAFVEYAKREGIF